MKTDIFIRAWGEYNVKKKSDFSKHFGKENSL